MNGAHSEQDAAIAQGVFQSCARMCRIGSKQPEAVGRGGDKPAIRSGPVVAPFLHQRAAPFEQFRTPVSGIGPR